MTPRHWKLVFVFLIGILCLPFGYLGAIEIHTPHAYQLPVSLVFSMMFGTLLIILVPPVWRFVKGSSSPRAFFFTHNSAEKIVIISHVESMIAAGEKDKAFREIELLLAMHGLDMRLCRMAVDFYINTLGESARAEALLRRMRNEQPDLYERYATQRLIDIYMTDANTHPKALTELRRLIAKFPGTPEANGAKDCIAQLQSEALRQTSAAPSHTVDGAALRSS